MCEAPCARRQDRFDKRAALMAAGSHWIFIPPSKESILARLRSLKLRIEERIAREPIKGQNEGHMKDIAALLPWIAEIMRL